MSKYLLAILFCFSLTIVFSQGNEVGLTTSAPDPVLKGFIKLYGDAKATWRESEGTYEASFKLINMPATAWFDSTGQRVNVVVQINNDQLPAIALSYIDRNYPKAKITKAQKWTDDKKVNTFQAEIKAGTDTKNLLFTSRGDLIKELGKE